LPARPGGSVSWGKPPFGGVPHGGNLAVNVEKGNSEEIKEKFLLYNII